MSRRDIVDRLTAFPAQLGAALTGLDAAGARQRPAAGGWSVIELVCHVRDYAEIFNSRLMRALSEENPRVASYENDDLAASREYLSQDLAAVVSAHARIRANMLETVARLTEDGWRRTVRHATWGEPTVEWLLNRCADHEAEHLADIVAMRGAVT